MQVSQVEEWIWKNAPVWNGASVHADPTQFQGNIQNLNRRGVRAKEFKFTTTSVGEVASSLVQAFRNRQIEVPNIPALKDELLKVRLKETTPGVTRLDHDSGAHDDQAITIGMGCRILLGGLGGVGANFREFMARRVQERNNATAEGDKSEELHRVEKSMTTRVKRERSERRRAVRRCPHRWSPGRVYCVFCGTRAEEVSA